MATFVKAKDCLLSRFKTLTSIQIPIIHGQRFTHTLQPRICGEMDSDSVTYSVNVSNWRKVDARSFGINSSVIPQPSWIVLKILRSKGFQSYLVGGCVRDLLLNKIPKDFDVITTANLKQVRKQFYRAEIVGRRFPICRVHIKGSVIEVSSFETVAMHAEGKEEVLSSQAPRGCDEKDLIRWRNSMHRDFTINSLFFDPFLNKIYDYANGIADLRSLKLRTLIPAYLSFKEDCARILRGLRIAARLGMSFSRDTETAIRNLSSSVERLDKSRIMMELNYMMSYGAAEPSLCLLRSYNLLEFFLPFHAAYLDEQASKTSAENSMMLMKLLFNLDKLVSCDRPADCTLWVGLLAFHQALVSKPQDAFVIWVFASVLYKGKWEEGVKFGREHAKDQVNFVSEISGFSEIKSDEELAEKVAHLASLVQDCVYGLTETDSGIVFVSKKIVTEVVQIFDVLVSSVESYNKGRESFLIDYHLLGKGNTHETRFVLGKIILQTMSGGLVGGERVIDEEKKNHLQLEVIKESCHLRPSDSTKDESLVKKNRKHSLAPPDSQPDLERTKKQKLAWKKCRVSEQELTMNKQEVVLKEGHRRKGKELQKVVETCRLPNEEIKVTEGTIIEEKDYHASSSEVIANEVNNEEIKVTEGTIIEEKDYHASSSEVIANEVKENSSRPLSSLFR